jgi:hypothetical protein
MLGDGGDIAGMLGPVGMEVNTKGHGQVRVARANPASCVACYFVGRPLVFAASQISLFIGAQQIRRFWTDRRSGSNPDGQRSD